tara:strand:+ start:2360 stop:2575 length:216 start_codon:yes stop_codon:yes gene_type:complete
MDSDWQRVKGLDGFHRDPASRALINTNKEAYVSYMENKRRSKQKNLEIQALKNEVSELKALVKTLVDKIDG